MPTADFNGVRIHYTLDGPESAPTLALSNSLGTDLHMWDKVLPALAGRFRVLRYDTRGHGQSGVSAPPYSIAQLAGDLLGLLDHLGLDRVNLCGVSLGGLTAIRLAIHEPSRFDRFIFANTSARIGSPSMWDDRIAAIRASGMKLLAKNIMGRWFTDGFIQQYPQELDLPRSVMEQTSPDGYIGCCLSMRNEDLRGDVARIHAPCLVITGESDIATPPAEGRFLNQNLPQSQYVELRAAHLSPWELPQEFESAVLNFLG
jgi:3-oxoadipate enol-lactonase